MSGRALKDFLVGGLVGFMSMMPGASGGMIAVVFGIYERLVADLADIRGRLLKDLGFVVPVGLGIVAGLAVCAVAINLLLQDWEVPMMFLFAALILCQIPDVRRMCDKGETAPVSCLNMVAFAAGLAVMVAFLFTGTSDFGISLMELDLLSVILLFVVGAVVALSKVVPGLSGAAILLAIGLYTPLMGLIGDTDLSSLSERIVALIPLGIGFVVGALLLAKAVDRLIRDHRRSTYYCILGLMVGSIITVCADGAMQYTDDMLAATIVCIVVGLLCGYAVSKLSARYSAESDAEDAAERG